MLGPPNKLEVDCLLAALRVASFHVPVVTCQTDAMLSRVDANDIGSLLSVVEEVTVCGNSFQASNSVIYRREFMNRKLHTKCTLMSVCHECLPCTSLLEVESYQTIWSRSSALLKKNIAVSCVFTIVVEAQCYH
ncbi:uncharacterized protein F5147DRAFT_762702 [Suillus discolor]|uniref:Uncharacterized protein n=1 Tax=Suillus discolor TaxID=1912936 RepID=A0A9P7F2E3_9AGAM|nr:uncharacterized protein F5147DRAFT_762702 [Suillus discolor]KAG2101311.1 hypothetical protein F5147DRAFT_762702 [Suillus discolor]